MSALTAQGRATIADIAARYGLSQDAVEHMARAVANGGGSMAQFNIPELGGNGQWMSGGMTMVGDMFNMGLQNTVQNLCGELSNAMNATRFFEQARSMGGSSWWPQWLGQPSSTGGQNQARYAYFPQARRLAFDHGDGRPVTLLDTGDHQIGGFSQQQSGPGDPYMGVSVSSQFGQFSLASFPFAPEDTSQASAPIPPQPGYDAPPEPVVTPGAPPPQAGNGEDILGTIERLARLRDAGALSDEEYSAKKVELLARL
jgi:hypothetical protein